MIIMMMTLLGKSIMLMMMEGAPGNADGDDGDHDNARTQVVQEPMLHLRILLAPLSANDTRARSPKTCRCLLNCHLRNIP